MKKSDNALTPPQAETLAHIGQYIAEHGYSPTVAELAKIAEVHPNAMSDRLTGLLRKKAITKTPCVARTIRPTENVCTP